MIIAAMIFAITKIISDTFSLFFSNNMCKTNAISDIKKSLSITSSITAPYITDAKIYAMVGFAI